MDREDVVYTIRFSISVKVVKYNLIHPGVQLNSYDGWQLVLVFSIC